MLEGKCTVPKAAFMKYECLTENSPALRASARVGTFFLITDKGY